MRRKVSGDIVKMEMHSHTNLKTHADTKCKPTYTPHESKCMVAPKNKFSRQAKTNFTLYENNVQTKWKCILEIKCRPAFNPNEIVRPRWNGGQFPNQAKTNFHDKVDHGRQKYIYGSPYVGRFPCAASNCIWGRGALNFTGRALVFCPQCVLRPRLKRIPHRGDNENAHSRKTPSLIAN